MISGRQDANLPTGVDLFDLYQPSDHHRIELCTRTEFLAYTREPEGHYAFLDGFAFVVEFVRHGPQLTRSRANDQLIARIESIISFESKH